MLELLQKRTGAAIFVTALCVRVIYLSFFTQPPVQFDARQYAAVAVVAPLAVTHPTLWNDTTARESISFTQVANDLVDNEDIVWAPYDPPSYGQALDWLFFSGPAYPAFLTAVFHLTPVYDFWFVRFIQAILDSLTALLIWFVMRRLISPGGGIAAAGLWVVYGPAIIKTGELLTETFAIFLTVSMIWSMLRAYDAQNGKWLSLAGGICSVLAMAKASTALMFIPILASWLWVNRKSALRPRRSIAIFFGSWVLVMLPWLLLVNHRFGRFAVRDPSYGDANFRQANILETEGYNTDLAPTDFWTYPVWREIQNHPLEYARLYLQKFRRLWWRACDDYRIGFPFGESGVQWLHKLMILFAAVGVCVWTKRAGPAAWLGIAVIVYFAGLHTLMHVVSRYNMLAMPFVIGAAVCGAMWLADETRRGFIRRFAIIVAIIALCAVVIGGLHPTTWLSVPGISLAAAKWLFWSGSAAALLAGAYAIVSMRDDSAIVRWILTATVGGMVVLVSLGWATTREAYAEWAAQIDEPGVVVKRDIVLPSRLAGQKFKLANILIDGRVAHGSSFKVILNIDHMRSAFPDSFFIEPESFYGKPHYWSFMRMNGDNPSNVRCWSRNIVEGPLLDSILQDGIVKISLRVEGNPEVEGYLEIFGDLPQDSARVFHGPGLTSSSIERYYEGTDPRIWDHLPLDTELKGSALVRDDVADTTDLSTCFGRQTGQYRIMLRLLLDNDRSLYF